MPRTRASAGESDTNWGSRAGGTAPLGAPPALHALSPADGPQGCPTGTPSRSFTWTLNKAAAERYSDSILSVDEVQCSAGKISTMSIADERSSFLLAHHAWSDGDIDSFVSFLSEDVVYIVNVDGLKVPYACSAFGREDVRQRMQLLLDTFVINAFVVETLVHESDHSRSTVLGYYKHKRTGERLDIKVRFHGWVENGLIGRLEEYHDAAYVEAFERFVRYLEVAASEAGRNPHGQSGIGDTPRT